MKPQKYADTVSIKDFGAKGDGIQDDTQAIQDALDTGVRKIIIPTGIFLISNAIKPSANQDIEIIGTLKVADANIQAIIADVVSGQSHVEVADASGYRVGQWVVLCDEDSPLWGIRIHGDCGRIIEIEGCVLRLEGKFGMSYQVAANARIGTCSSAILIENKSNIRIHGGGIIDGNKSNQIDVRPTVMIGCVTRTSLRSEEFRASCGIVSSGLPGSMDNITIESITVRDANAHNICLIGVRNSRILNTLCIGCHDKNITLLDSHDIRIAGNIAAFSVWEDGIMLHPKTGNRRFLIQGNICMGSPRVGIGVGVQEDEIHLSGNLCVNNALHINLDGDNCSSTGDICQGKNHNRNPREFTPAVSFGGKNTRISNLMLLPSDRAIGVELVGAEDLTWIGGLIKGGSVIEDGDTGMILKESATNSDMYPERVLIQGVKIEGFNTGIKIHDKAKSIKLIDNTLLNNRQSMDWDSEGGGDVVFVRNYGFVTANKGLAIIKADQKSVTISHKLNIKPSLSDIQVTPANNLGDSLKFWITNLTDTTFDIFVDTEPSSCRAEFSWRINIIHQTI